MNEIYRAIGALTAEVAGLRRDIQEADARAAENDRRAGEYRATIHRRVDEIVNEVGAIKVDMTSMKSDLSDTKNVTDEVKRWKLMGIGALGVTGIAASAMGSAVTYFWSDFLKMFRAG